MGPLFQGLSTRSRPVMPTMEIESGESGWWVRARWIRKRSPSSHSMTAVLCTTRREGGMGGIDSPDAYQSGELFKVGSVVIGMALSCKSIGRRRSESDEALSRSRPRPAALLPRNVLGALLLTQIDKLRSALRSTAPNSVITDGGRSKAERSFTLHNDQRRTFRLAESIPSFASAKTNGQTSTKHCSRTARLSDNPAHAHFLEVAPPGLENGLKSHGLVPSSQPGPVPPPPRSRL